MNRWSLFLSFVFVACSTSEAQDAIVETPVPAPVLLAATPNVDDVDTAEEEEGPRKIIIPRSDRNRRNAILIARVAVNENTRPLRPIEDGGSAGEPTSDAKALIQEMVSFAEWKGVSLRKAATWQSKYVTGVKEAKEGSQHAWTSTLPARGKKVPKGWIECSGKDDRGEPSPEGCDGRWEIYADNWVAFRTWMIDQVTGGEILAECEGNPITWGGDMDDHIAIRRGLCVIEGCGDRNTWWAFPGQGCDEPMRDILARERPRKKVKTISAREIMKALRNPS